MLQLDVTDERGAVTSFVVKKFPFVIGRSPLGDLPITSAGVWEQHATIRLADREQVKTQRFVVESIGQSIVSINGDIALAQALSVGDVISLGAARLTVSLAPSEQSMLAWHELTVWALLLGVVILEALVVHFAR